MRARSRANSMTPKRLSLMAAAHGGLESLGETVEESGEGGAGVAGADIVRAEHHRELHHHRVRLCAVRLRVLGGPDTDREHDAGRTSASVCACRLECGCVPCQLAVDTSTSTPTDSPTRAPLCIIVATCVC